LKFINKIIYIKINIHIDIQPFKFMKALYNEKVANATRKEKNVIKI
jgi:hypothetical protein